MDEQLHTEALHLPCVLCSKCSTVEEFHHPQVGSIVYLSLGRTTSNPHEPCCKCLETLLDCLDSPPPKQTTTMSTCFVLLEQV